MGQLCCGDPCNKTQVSGAACHRTALDGEQSSSNPPLSCPACCSLPFVCVRLLHVPLPQQHLQVRVPSELLEVFAEKMLQVSAYHVRFDCAALSSALLPASAPCLGLASPLLEVPCACHPPLQLACHALLAVVAELKCNAAEQWTCFTALQACHALLAAVAELKRNALLNDVQGRNDEVRRLAGQPALNLLELLCCNCRRLAVLSRSFISPLKTGRCTATRQPACQLGCCVCAVLCCSSAQFLVPQRLGPVDASLYVPVSFTATLCLALGRCALQVASSAAEALAEAQQLEQRFLQLQQRIDAAMQVCCACWACCACCACSAGALRLLRLLCMLCMPCRCTAPAGPAVPALHALQVHSACTGCTTVSVLPAVCCQHDLLFAVSFQVSLLCLHAVCSWCRRCRLMRRLQREGRAERSRHSRRSRAAAMQAMQ